MRGEMDAVTAFAEAMPDQTTVAWHGAGSRHGHVHRLRAQRKWGVMLGYPPEAEPKVRDLLQSWFTKRLSVDNVLVEPDAEHLGQNDADLWRVTHQFTRIEDETDRLGVERKNTWSAAEREPLDRQKRDLEQQQTTIQRQMVAIEPDSFKGVQALAHTLKREAYSPDMDAVDWNMVA